MVVNPQSTSELVIESPFTLTHTQNQFVRFETGPGEDRVPSFGSQTGLRFLSECTAYFIDGTFNVAPPIFSQFYSIHGKSMIHLNKLNCQTWNNTHLQQASNRHGLLTETIGDNGTIWRYWETKLSNNVTMFLSSCVAIFPNSSIASLCLCKKTMYV